jgi:hypothetical protein
MIEPIVIDRCVETVDLYSSPIKHRGASLYKLLISPEEWTDDMIFEAESGEVYFIDDLVGKKVRVGTFIFVVQED